MKEYTDLEQSKVLKDILSRESAYMSYKHFTPELAPDGYGISLDTPEYDDDIPCWSLAALIEYLRQNNMFSSITYSDRYVVEIKLHDNNSQLHYFWSERDNLVDACYDMICNLYKKGYLNKADNKNEA